MSLQVAVSARSGFVPAPVPPPASWTRSPTSDGSENIGLFQKGTVVNFLSDEGIYSEGDEAKSFYKVVSGVVRTCKFLNDGRRQIEAFHVTGDVFGLERSGERRLCAEAVSDCTLISYRRHGLEKFTATDDGLAQELFSCVMQYVERAQEHSLLLGRSCAAQKVAAFLLEMAHRSPRSATIELAMTRQDIADYLGLTIETVSRTLSQLEREGLIARPSARRIVLRNQAALRTLTS
jgi:CRP/FNR family transcriptional regulator, nitrogen fixation regulation protein